VTRVLIKQVLSVCHGKGFSVSVSIHLIGEFITMARVLGSGRGVVVKDSQDVPRNGSSTCY
jgi:hypothetical protein